MLFSVVLLLILWLILKPGNRSGFPSYTPYSAHVLYDESHENVWGIWDTGYFGYSEFARALVDRGVPVSCVARPLHEVLAGKTTWQYDQTILILSVARYQRYSSDEIEAVVNFVDNGGLLLVIGEHDNMFQSSDFHNALLQKFGLRLNNDFTGKTIDPNTISMNHISILNQKAVSRVFGLTNVMHMLSASIDFTGKGEPVVLLEGERGGDTLPIAMGVRRGRGAVLVLGDSEMLWNADGIIGIGAGDNMNFMLSCVQWLLRAELEKVKQPVVSNRVGEKNTTIVRFARELSGTGIDSTPSGLRKFASGLNGYSVIDGKTHDDEKADVLIVTAPLKPLKKEDYKGRRLIVFAESYMVPEKFTVWGSRLLNMGAKPGPRVYDTLWDTFGVTVRPCFLTDGGVKNSYLDCTIPYGGENLSLHRSGSLVTRVEKTRKNYFLYRIALPDAIWGETSHPGIQVKNDGRPLYQSSDVEEPILVYADDTILLLADSDIVSNQNAGTGGFRVVLKLVRNWIRDTTTK